MFYQLFIIAIYCLLPQQYESFEGIIKYNNPETNDSLIYYIRKDKVRINRKGDFVAKYGNYTDEFLDLEKNQSILYNVEKGEQDFFNNFKTYFEPKEKNDSTLILNYTCHLFEINYGSVGYGGKMQDELYVADDLFFTMPENCKIQNSIFTNGTGKITLKSIRKVDGKDDYHSETTWEAVEIIPMKITDDLLMF